MLKHTVIMLKHTVITVYHECHVLQMYMINHSLNYKFLGSDNIIFPDRAEAATTNSVAS
jgi:hypothetical protein